ncbi:MAG: hypothetical protein ACE5KG_00250 [Nitrososphaerales archaeon]
MWLRHGVDVWHYECRMEGDLHDYIAEIVRNGEVYELNLSGQDVSRKKTFGSPSDLNAYLKSVGMEDLKV